VDVKLILFHISLILVEHDGNYIKGDVYCYFIHSAVRAGTHIKQRESENNPHQRALFKLRKLFKLRIVYCLINSDYK